MLKFKALFLLILSISVCHANAQYATVTLTNSATHEKRVFVANNEKFRIELSPMKYWSHCLVGAVNVMPKKPQSSPMTDLQVACLTKSGQSISAVCIAVGENTNEGQMILLSDKYEPKKFDISVEVDCRTY